MQGVYPTFTWWQGVVEDRNDPAELGRVRVRILGYHTENREDLPTSDLPLAVLMQPVNSASISGIGNSATGLLEGSHVFGFFADGADGQIPVIMGSLAALSMQPPHKDNGFADPNGVYPLSDLNSGRNTVPESDMPRLAREKMAEKHFSLAAKRATRIEEVPIAFAPELGPKDEEVDKLPKVRYKESFWTEPHPQGSSSTKTKYPYNHVRESESGHVFEVDDSPGAERIHTYHRTGTFEEIQPDGTKVNKVVGKDYEIVIQDKNMFIKGDFNITVEGDMTLNVKGDYYEDITGNKFSTVRKNRHSKTQGNEMLDVMSDYGLNISGSRGVTVNCEGTITPGSDNEIVRGDKFEMISKNHKTVVGFKSRQSANDGFDISTLFGNYSVSTTGLFGPAFGGNIELRTPTLNRISFGTGTFNLGASVAANFGTPTNPIALMSTWYGVASTLGGAYTINTGAYSITTAAYTGTMGVTSLTTGAFSVTAAGGITLGSTAAVIITGLTISLN